MAVKYVNLLRYRRIDPKYDYVRDLDLSSAGRFSFCSIMLRSVADFCQQHSLTVVQLAEQANLEEGRVLAIVLGRWTPSPAERQKIAAVFGVAVDEITWGHKTPIQHLYGHGPG